MWTTMNLCSCRSSVLLRRILPKSHRLFCLFLPAAKITSLFSERSRTLVRRDAFLWSFTKCKDCSPPGCRFQSWGRWVFRRRMSLVSITSSTTSKLWEISASGSSSSFGWTLLAYPVCERRVAVCYARHSSIVIAFCGTIQMRKERQRDCFVSRSFWKMCRYRPLVFILNSFSFVSFKAVSAKPLVKSVNTCSALSCADS